MKPIEATAEPDEPTPIELAVKAAGGLQSFADKLGVKYQAVQKWIRFDRIPAERVLAIESVTGISRSDLRPDLYPRETAQGSGSPRRPVSA